MAFSRSRGLAIGAVNGVYGAGGFLGAVLSGYMTVMYGWRSIFLLLATLATVFSIGQLLFFKPPSFKKTAAIRASTTKSRVTHIFTRNILVIILTMAIADFSFIAFKAWSPTFLVRVDTLTLPEAGIVLGIFGILGAVGSVVFGTLSDKLGRKRMVAASGIASGLIAGLFFSAVHSFFILVLLAAALGFCGYAYWSLLISSAQDSVDRKAVGTVTGLVQTSAVVGAIPAPAVVAALIPAWKISGALLISTAIPCFIFGLLVLAISEPKQPVKPRRP